MTGKVTTKDGAEAVAMLDGTRKRTRATRPAAEPKTKAEKVRAAYLADPNARPVDVAKATGVEASYVWDIREAMRRKGTIPMPEPKAVAS